MSLGAKRHNDLRLHGLTDLLQAISTEFPSARASKSSSNGLRNDLKRLKAIESRHITSHSIMLYDIILHYTTLHNITLYYVVLYYIILYYIILYYIILHYIILYYIILYYITLHYIILFYPTDNFFSCHLVSRPRIRQLPPEALGSATEITSLPCAIAKLHRWEQTPAPRAKT